MDWPSRPGLPPEVQRAELLVMLARAVSLGLNAVILQVRPAGDALYASPYEPWSEYLNGQRGRAPSPHYDPLDFAVREAQRRGLELHAWFNPFRARDPTARGSASPDHFTRVHPGLVRRYGSYLWMEPSEPAVHDQAIKVILDVARRYDVDGIHIDDYFYPYRVNDSGGRTIPFPDDENYERYRRSGGTLGRSDWRRSNVDRFVERLYGELKGVRPHVKFGISPFGIWRPGYPAQIQGLDAYEEIYADARKWLNNGWLDYFVPQLYWPVNQRPQAFPVLLDWWVGQNSRGRHIWPGSFSDRVSEGRWPASEIVNQVDVTRQNPGASGNVFFRMRSLMSTRNGLYESLSRAPYNGAALVPASPWLSTVAPPRPRAAIQLTTPGRITIAVAPGGAEEVFLWTVRSRSPQGWRSEVVPGWKRELTLTGTADPIVITAVGRTGNESEPVVLRSE
ncbi:MAG: family 10 glycosylhydrolase [Gemmatimonadetes bacterium]|nr:family 10 glycosylhydrolase [Gemmatimonadota bacterium]